MFIPNNELNKTSLKQGDVINGIQILGALNYGAINTLNNRTEPIAWQYNAKPCIGPAIILSHSCELAPENGVKLTSIILAPLRDIETASRPEKIDELISSNIVRPDSEISYLKYFYIEPNDLLPFARGAVVDFSKLFSLKKDTYDYLLDKKILQLTDDTRCALSIKHALFYYRTLAA